ncbi:hypothetical protein EW146_g5406 [Bondarzewia mesenterica]|uniref:Uncharacterized protein n=1 Tax=Bondarzewia mesenterica TaxID=1095465 RepID=A0A4S4LSN5_9AGAM|nr:hypothetical protein EW146_g5406 [Bondarzewia mesenterica]
MTSVTPNHTAVVSENWDDDFEFQTANDTKQPVGDFRDIPSTRASPSRRLRSNIIIDDTTMSSTFRQNGAEPGPSTPPRRNVLLPTENWDADFEDTVESPVRRNGESSRAHRNPPRLPRTSHDTENWDDDFDIDKGNSPPRDATWESSDEDDGLGFADQEEDRTVTARSRRTGIPKQFPPPRVPPFPSSLLQEPFPGSPTMSMFSIPSGHDSVAHSYASHVPLRAGNSSALAMLPPSPPIHKERRRLRKKSRPPDNTLFELLDRDRDGPPPVPSPPHPPPTEISMTPPDHPATKTPLLSRIGSVKKWGTRRKRASTDPSEVILNEVDTTQRPPSSMSHTHAHANSPSSSSKHSGWFFRSGGDGADTPGSPSSPNAAELRHEKSIDRLKAFSTAIDSPNHAGKKPTQQLGFHPAGSRGSTPDRTPPPSPSVSRRPTSMQVPPGKPIFPRHASHGAMTLGRSTSRSTFSTSTDDLAKHGREREKEGHRGFMGGIRRISLVSGQKKHQRTKSTAGEEHEGVPPTPAVVIPELPVIAGQIPSDQLLPPIELEPPSPSKVVNGNLPYRTEPMTIPPRIESALPRSSIEISASLPPPSVVSPFSSPSRLSTSPHSASLGRSTQLPNTVATGTIVPRRNSLGDLKIPARISQAQIGLKRDLGMVREFAASVDKLKELVSQYQFLAHEVQAIIMKSTSRPPSRTKSPAFSLSRHHGRARSNTNPVSASDSQNHIATSFHAIDVKYKISWECAELLIELGGGNPAPVSPPSSTTFTSGTESADAASNRLGRERAITLAGDEPKPSPLSTSSAGSPSLGWRASTGRNDLSQRQLSLLRDMLNNPDSSAALIPEETLVNRNWRWGDAMSSTVTLPSEESAHHSSSSKKRRSSRLGMSGLRDMLRSITRGHDHQHGNAAALQTSSASASTGSSLDGHDHLRPPSRPGHSLQRRRSKTSVGLTSTSPARATSPFSTSASFAHKSSPRRPSLTSIFRFAQKNKTISADSSHTAEVPKGTLHSSSSGSDFCGRSMEEEEDWDHLESTEELDAAAKALGLGKDGNATVRGRKAHSPYLSDVPTTPKKTATASHSSISLWTESSTTPVHSIPLQSLSRPMRLSNVEESTEFNLRGGRVNDKTIAGKSRSLVPSASIHRQRSARRPGNMSGSVRSAPPSSFAAGFGTGEGADPKLAMTPENIRPLLENAREVHAQCMKCLEEMRLLLAASAS